MIVEIPHCAVRGDWYIRTQGVVGRGTPGLFVFHNYPWCTLNEQLGDGWVNQTFFVSKQCPLDVQNNIEWYKAVQTDKAG